MKQGPDSRRAALAGLAALLAGGCGVGRWFGGVAPDGTVSGTAAWGEDIVLPPGASLAVRLEERARPGAAPALIAEQTMDGRGRQPPLAFELRYKGDAISPEREYFVSAEVLFRERPMLATAAPQPVLTRGRASKGIRLLLTRPGGAGEE